MKKRPKSRVRTTSNSGIHWSQYCIIVLLAFLVILTGTELYLDYFNSDRKDTTKKEPIIDDKTVETEDTALIDKPKLDEKKQEKFTPPPQPVSASDIKVQVLNGCGVSGIAGRVRGILRDRGFDVISYGNARKQNHSQSHIIIRSEGSFGERAAEILAESMGIAPEQIRSERDPSLVDINVTVVLGLDYRHINLSSE
ncbi:MAG: LytR C-terminal domain-containing protein [bacterium]